MAVAYESVTNVTTTTTTTLSITKPTGLAEGDWLFAQLISVGATYSVPTGWTAIHNGSTSQSGALLYYAVMNKVADSSDVAASTFDFTNSNNDVKSGALLRISGVGVIDDSDTYADTATTTDPYEFASNIDPAFADGLGIFFLFAGDNTTNTIGLGDISIATSNPTWTSRASDARNSTTSYARNLFTGSRSADTAWGNATLDWSQTGSGIGFRSVHVSLAPIVNGSHAVSTGTVNIVNHPFLISGALTAQGNTLVANGSTPTTWTPVDKS